MARDVDRVIRYVEGLDGIPPVMRRVMVNRLDPPPTDEEVERAAREVYPDQEGGR